MTKEFSCQSCGFMVRSDKDDELIDFVKEHANDAHDTEMSSADIKDGWKTV